VPIARGKLAHVEVDELLKQEVVDRGDAIEIVRRDAQIERDPLFAEGTQIEIALGRRRIDIGVEPEIDLGRDGLSDRGERVVRGSEPVPQR
jgi:hypothetical protein